MSLYRRAKKKLDGTWKEYYIEINKLQQGWENWNRERLERRDRLYTLRGFLETLFLGKDERMVKEIKALIDTHLKSL